MSSPVQSRPRSIELPGGATKFEIVFAPTRTRLQGAVLTRPNATEDDAVVARGHIRAGLTVSFDIADPSANDSTLELRTTFYGEEPQPYFLNWRTADGWVELGRTSTDVHRELLEQRAALAATKEEHAFFFELDRLTLDEYVAFDFSVTEAERKYRNEAFDCLADLMMTRLSQRYDEPRAQLDESKNAEMVAYFSNLFWGATAKLYRTIPIPEILADRANRVGNALLQFAAGVARYDIPEAGRRMKVTVSDPDSYFVFFFAEFGAIARELRIHSDAWTALWPWTVDMQRQYVARYLDDDGVSHLEKVTEANFVKRPLPNVLVQRGTGDPEQRIHEELNTLGRKGFGDSAVAQPACDSMKFPNAGGPDS